MACYVGGKGTNPTLTVIMIGFVISTYKLYEI